MDASGKLVLFRPGGSVLERPGGMVGTSTRRQTVTRKQCIGDERGLAICAEPGARDSCIDQVTVGIAQLEP